MLWSQGKLRYCQHDRVTSPLEKYTRSIKSSDNFIANDRIIKCFGVFFGFFKTSTAVHETNIQNKLSAIQVWFSLVCAFAASSGVTSPPRGEATTTFFQAQQFDGGKPRRARRSTSTARKTRLFLARWDVLTVTLETQHQSSYWVFVLFRWI